MHRNMLKSTQNLGMESGILLNISTTQEHQLSIVLIFKTKEFPEIVTETGLQIRVCTGKLFFLSLNQNICCGYSKEPSQ